MGMQLCVQPAAKLDCYREGWCFLGRWTTIGEDVGQRNLAVTANTYTHVLSDETELDYQLMLR
jgi:hypothetical protein